MDCIRCLYLYKFDCASLKRSDEKSNHSWNMSFLKIIRVIRSAFCVKKFRKSARTKSKFRTLQKLVKQSASAEREIRTGFNSCHLRLFVTICSNNSDFTKLSKNTFQFFLSLSCSYLLPNYLGKRNKIKGSNTDILKYKLT